ncbi:hypothetical protein VB712_14125 [Spirulina sp. CCNP1310]|uniref:hypothetical protein n=1 Tax=Spirulina sp. CCNP1310 TaxID=3110249 RepID=UPI002B221787|nr:hypothetical protein [Spirulina sp. CCNP1310]MEA5420365.1 hypothetical protein [Spirulina sp. CCNP1310]
MEPLDDWQTWIAPALADHWRLGKHRENETYLLMGGNLQIPLTPEECQVLRYFNGKTTLGEIPKHCGCHPTLIPHVLTKLLDGGVLSFDDPVEEPAPVRGEGPRLREGVEWRSHPDGYWVLRNPIHKTYMQAGDPHKAVMDHLGEKPIAQLLAETGLEAAEFQEFWRGLAVTGMLEGIDPPKPPKKKFTPMQLLFYKMPLINPDRFLTAIAPALGWLWSGAFLWSLWAFLGLTFVVGMSERGLIFHEGKQIMTAYGSSLWLPFGIIAVTVVTFHELGHALTLKHYGGDVCEMGLLWMCLFPAAYTDSTDSYCLKRSQRIAVVGAGLVVQVAIAAGGFWMWQWITPGTALHTSSFLIMAAGLFTVLVNLNPLARFDGYYLIVAMTGINNLRSRSFLWYMNLFTGKPTEEDPQDALVMAIYAPVSLLYVVCIFGFLIWSLLNWILLNAPMTALLLLLIWLIYYYWPESKQTA